MSSKTEKYSLNPGAELRFDIREENEKVTVELMAGHAECFGTELVTNRKYEFGCGTKIAIFTYHGCYISASGNFDAYNSGITPMYDYLRFHTNLENLRRQAKESKSRGPVVMIAGGRDVGKSTISKLLLNYAVRGSWKPIHVNIDPRQGSAISIPGTISASFVDATAPVAADFFDEEPLVYHYGHVSSTDNSSHFKIKVSELAKKTLSSLDDGKNQESGIIIDTFSVNHNSALLNLVHAATEFEVGIIYVVHGERLAFNLRRNLPASVEIVNLFKSMGVVEKTEETRLESTRTQIKEYFYGNNFPLYPHSIIAQWSDLNIYKIGAPVIPESCLALGMAALDHETKLVIVKPGPKLLYHMLGVCFGKMSDEELLKTNVAGFVCVTNVDVEKETVTLLSPHPQILPDATYFMSDFQYLD